MDATGQYLNEIARHPLLTPTEEIEYSRLIQAMIAIQAENPDPASYTKKQRIAVRRGQRAKEQMITRNLRLVVTVAKKYARRAESLDLLDLVQEGNIGLARATELFDYSRGYKFSTYAYWWIRQSISRSLQDRDRTIRMPIHRQETLNKARVFTNEQLARTGRAPSAEQIADALGVDFKEFQYSLCIAQGTISLDSTAGNDPSRSDLIDLIPDDRSLDIDDDYMIERDILARAVSMLDPTERDIVERYNGLNGHDKATLTALGNDYGLSRERIRQIHGRAINKVHRKIRILMQEPGLPSLSA